MADHAVLLKHPIDFGKRSLPNDVHVDSVSVVDGAPLLQVRDAAYQFLSEGLKVLRRDQNQRNLGRVPPPGVKTKPR